LNKIICVLFCFFILIHLHAKEETSSSIKNFEQKLPHFNFLDLEVSDSPINSLDAKKVEKPEQIVDWNKITSSGISRSSIKVGAPIIRIKDYKRLSVSKEIVAYHYNLEDENGFKYIISKDQSVKFKIDSKYLQNIKRELDLYVPPSTYSEYNRELEKVYYDEKLNFNFEANVYAGYVQGNFFKDLLNESKSVSGQLTQINVGTHLNWKYVIKPGFVLNYDKTLYYFSEEGKGTYQSLSLGPQFKTQNLKFKTVDYLLQIQFRISPFSKLIVSSDSGIQNFSFNSSEVAFSLEFPSQNFLGEFSWGFFLNSQWLNLKNQTEGVNIRASNKSNLGSGLKLGQVF